MDEMRGFSLLEMLVVLAILGLAAGLVAPSLFRTVDRVRAAGQRDAIQRLILAMPVIARSEGRAIVWSPGAAVSAPAGSAWPEGWQVYPLTPLYVGINGWCSGARLEARGPGERMGFEVLSPDCRVSWGRDAP